MDPKTDYSVWRFWFDIGQYIVAFFIAFYIWLSNRDKARSKDLKDAETRITKLESSSITHEDLGKVHEKINDVSVQVSGLTGTTNGIKGAVDMIQEHLLSNGGKK